MNATRNGATRLLVALVSAVVLMAGVALAPARAQELAPEHLALARQYVDLTDNSKIFETTLIQSGIDTMRTIMRTNPEIQKQTDDAIGRTIASYVGHKSDLLDQFARVYALRFSMEELKQIVDFYSTPTGMKLSAANREINTELGRVLGVFNNNLKTEFFAKVRADLKDQGVEI